MAFAKPFFRPEDSSICAQLATTFCTEFRTEGVPLVCLNQRPWVPLQHKPQSRFCVTNDQTAFLDEVAAAIRRKTDQRSVDRRIAQGDDVSSSSVP
jgi:hypothetical protein